MKKILPGLLMLVVLRCTPSEKHYDRVDAQRGYKDLTLDAPYEQFRGKVEMRLTLADSCKATKKYQITSQKYLQMGAVQFHTAELEFVRDTLIRTTLYTKDSYESAGQLQALYRQEFGQPQEVKAVDYKSTNWNGQNYTLHLIDNRKSNDIELEYASIKGIQQSIAAEKACQERKINGHQK
ncbi:hypothetical protein [Larkinella rosea]|uniref:Uncharacterized protein n=1 Tax=Larkinella rosea TaxID=2025312 RepID=A0A3P1BAA3_9BACT|nr:hypothetical protein [Larkinella rosea]RRA97573.1 hypothetical protein EHT25_31465 [Larkinella rosea]